jgi:putative cell wall-binding protein
MKLHPRRQGVALRRVAAFALVALLSAAGVGCAASDDPAGVEATLDEIGTIDPNTLITDNDLEGYQHVTAAQVQRFLEQKGSALARYSEGGRSAAELIVQQSLASRISPVYMLARIQTESSLVGSGTLARLSQATGCGCPDGSACDPARAGFAAQVACSAQGVRRYLTDLSTRGVTISGWRVGVSRQTSDPCTVRPTNRATAALYTYTPWVGAYAAGCGRTDVGGSSLVALLLQRYIPSFSAPPPPLTCAQVQRIAGADRYATAAAISRASFPTTAATVVIVAGDGATLGPDGPVAATLAARLRGPVLLTDADALPAATAAELARLRATAAVIVGGTGAVAPAVATRLAALGLAVTRLAGESRYETAARVAERVGAPQRTAFVADGDGLVDAATVAGAAGALGAPLLYVTATTVPAATAAALAALGVTRTYVVGGPDAVADGVLRQLPGPTRVAGADRYETAVDVATLARGLGVATSRVVVTQGDDLTDVAAAGATRQVVLLSRSAGLPGSTRTFLAASATTAWLVGGTTALSDQVQRDACAALRP